MAAFREHVIFSTVLGAGYAFVLNRLGFEPGQALLAGTLCGLAGMLPDLDSDSGKPIKELFGLLAAVAALFVFHRLRRAELPPADRILAAGFCYLLVRFGVRWLFARFTVHRGMWHSLPVALLVSQWVFLAGDDVLGEENSLALGGAVFLGFVSHLLLDEIYSFQFKGFLPSFKSSSGTALKLFSDSKIATIGTWLVLAVVSYQSAVRLGYAADYLPSAQQIKQSAQAGFSKLGGAKQ
jgi:membrane-bound metal-dependent hydrolase YbcI (DUF457 family)